MPDDPKNAPRQQILDLLRNEGATTIDTLTTALGLSKTATRAHIVRLEATGLIERVALDPSDAPSSPGRPPAAYGLTNAGGARFPTDDAMVLTRLVEFLEQRDEALVTEFLENLWAERLDDVRNELGTADIGACSLPARLGALERVLTQSNFLPTIHCEQAGGSAAYGYDSATQVVVRECNCPLPSIVRASRIPCRLETTFLETVVGAEVEHVSLAADRRGTCVFQFTVPDA